MNKLTAGVFLFLFISVPTTSTSTIATPNGYDHKSNLRSLSDERMKEYQQNMQIYTDKLDTIIKLLSDGKTANVAGD